jgi:hypothetical protein
MRDYSRSVRGKPKERNTLGSANPVIAATRLPRTVRTISPYAWRTAAWGVSQVTAERGLAVCASRNEAETLKCAAGRDGGEELADRERSLEFEGLRWHRQYGVVGEERHHARYVAGLER